jgi:hypothetical protein
MVKRCRMESRVREQRGVMEWFLCDVAVRGVKSVTTLAIEVSPYSEFI